MTSNPVSLLDTRREGPPEQGNVLVVPRVAIGNGGPVGDTGNLVAIVPPGQDAGVLGCVVPEPPIALAVVIDHDFFSALEAALLDNGGVGEVVGQHVALVVVRAKVGLCVLVEVECQSQPD